MAAIAVGALIAACSSSKSGSGEAATPNTSGIVGIAGAASCDIIDPAACLLPFPSNRFTVKASTPTGVVVSFDAAAMPANAAKKRPDPADWSRQDGFSPVSPILADLPRLDPEASGLAGEDNIGRSMDDDSPTVLWDATTNERLAHWVELDRHSVDDSRRLTIIRPAAALPAGHRIVVMFRHLVDDRGRTVQPSAAFAAIRDERPTGTTAERAAIAARAAELGPVLDEVEKAGFGRGELTLAWDFTVASDAGLSGDLLAMRNDLYKRLNYLPPIYQVTTVISDAAKLPAGIGRIVRGNLLVPSYLSGKGERGARIRRNQSGVPVYAGNQISVPYSCALTSSQMGAGGTVVPAKPVVYGHGLLSDHTEAERADLAKGSQNGNLMHCATDWLGLARPDTVFATSALSDIAAFPAVADRLEQGIIDQLVLARALVHPLGFRNHPAFKACPYPGNGVACVFPDQSTLDDSGVVFEGDSLGGIMGVAATAISADWTKAALGVAGMGFSTMIDRSVAFAPLRGSFESAYPDPVDRQLVLGLVQMLWDSAEASGYAAHLTDHPLPGTPEHHVLVNVAFGDPVVPTVTAWQLARTAAIPVRQPVVSADRAFGADRLFGLNLADEFPVTSDAMFVWDSGVLAPPPGNLNPTEFPQWKRVCDVAQQAPTSGDVAVTAECADPHEVPRNQPAYWQQRRIFFDGGTIIDACSGDPCIPVKAS